MFLLISISLVYASEEEQVEKAYSCLEGKTNTTAKCSALSFDEKVFSLLATGNCQNETSRANITSNQCWTDLINSNSCKIKPTAQAVLALNEKKVNTTKAENWLLTQTAIPTEMDWFLEIESSKSVTCQIGYLEKSYTLSIGVDKKISSSNLGNCLTLSTGVYKDYFLLISPSCYNMKIDISCSESFITTLLFKKKDSDSNPLNVLEGHSASARGTTTEKVDSFCFSQSGICNYEGSLWATFVLYSLNYDVSRFMPYLITMMDENKTFLPESFLYFLTGEFRVELLSKQIFNKYWDVSGNKYYDTALALWPFYYESPFEKENSKSWLLEVQQKTGINTGCWNSGNLIDTAFILYSIWPKSPALPLGECTFDSECNFGTSCEISSCDYGWCSYEPLGCIHNDGCCNYGCTIANDNDCDPGENTCNTASDCKNYVLPDEDNYCSVDKTKVYKNDSKWICENKVCAVDETPKLVESCSINEKCSAGSCLGIIDIPDDECESTYDCDYGKSCINGYCILDEALDCIDEGYFCMSRANCEGEILDDYSDSCTGVYKCCDTEISLGTCFNEGGEICASDELCMAGTTVDVYDTEYGEVCCIGGTCEKESEITSDCEDNDGICKSSCGNNEEEDFNYDCDYGESCCISKVKLKSSYLWIWVLLILILFSALGIVFRDKLRTQLLKLKTLFGGKKDKRRFDMPLTPHPNPQGRILPRRIFSPQSSGAPVRKPFAPQHYPANKKPEEKSKNELDDVLKKLKEMGK